jgi:outer membrane lipopolysaccharide assembly protein LptE/RlpB
MTARAMTLSIVLLAVVLTAACGADSSGQTAMDVKFQQLDYKMVSMETLNSSFDTHLQTATHQYIALVRKYAPQLGRKEAKRRLEQKSAEVSAYCVPCTATLDDEAKRY